MAVEVKNEIQSPIIALSDKAFDAYCLNLSGLFNIEVLNKRHDMAFQGIKQLKKQFKKLTAIHSFKSEGALKGDFYIIFDTDTLFALAGIVLQLSEDDIREKIENGTAKEADDIYDAVAEAANLLIASWDNTFHEHLENHNGLTKTDTVIESSLAKVTKNLELPKDEELLLITYHLMIKDWPEFKCFVVFTKSFLEDIEVVNMPTDSSADDAQPEPDENTEEAKAEEPEKENEPQAENSEQNPEEEQAKDETEDVKAEPQETDQPAETEDEVSKAEPQDNHEQDETADEGEVSKAIQEMVSTADETTDIPPEALINISKAIPSLNLTAKDIMQTNILWAEPDESVQQLQSKMQQHDATYILVGENQVLEGIVSMSDVRDAISPYLKSTFSKWRRPLDDATLQIRSKWIMTRAIHTIKPDMPLSDILIHMCNYNIRCLPVINKDNKVEGIITVFDIFKAMINNSNIGVAGKAVQTPSQS
ncbi:MAG: CBS domain-containing protein [Planctomycetota bacterium]|jgi:acetoin utilization protein AcuB